ncbi:unnamed protein product [Merluccius merluccius]
MPAVTAVALGYLKDQSQDHQNDTTRYCGCCCGCCAGGCVAADRQGPRLLVMMRGSSEANAGHRPFS